MISWAKRKVVSFLTWYVEREIVVAINAGDYSTALDMTGKYCKSRNNNYRAYWFHALSLMGLDRFDEALEIINRFENLFAEGNITLTREWHAAFSEVKCRILYGMYDYAGLSRYAKIQHQLFPKKIAFISYAALAALKVGNSNDFVTFADLMWESKEKINESWSYELMVAGYRWIGNNSMAVQVANEGKKHFPHDASLDRVIANPNLVPIGEMRNCICEHIPNCRRP